MRRSLRTSAQVPVDARHPEDCQQGQRFAQTIDAGVRRRYRFAIRLRRHIRFWIRARSCYGRAFSFQRTHAARSPIFSISSRISSARQAVACLPSLTGCGNRPSATPAHQVERETGMNCRTVGNRTKPVGGNMGGVGFFTVGPHSIGSTVI